MSRFVGDPGSRWPLAAAVDALTDAVRQVRRPGWYWLAALAYPSVVLSLGVLSLLTGVLERVTGKELIGASSASTSSGVDSLSDFLRALQSGLFAGDIWSAIDTTEERAVYLTLLPICLPLLLRLAAGLAAISAPESWSQVCAGRQSPGLGSVWRAGKSLMRPALGLWLALQFLFASALLVLCYPIALAVGALGLDRVPGPLWILVAPAFVILGCYGTTLLVLNHLALQSLARNQRGSGSALIHAWRLVRGDPWATVRALAMDLVLTASVLLLSVAVETVLPSGPGALLALAMLGFSGAVRAAFWARAYRALGGLSAADGVPGLQPASSGGPPRLTA